jgi:hypothetical protein
MKMKVFASLAQAIGVFAFMFTTAPARAFTMTFDELGNCSSTVGTCSSTKASDPFNLVSGNVLIFTTPSFVFTGIVDVLDPDGITISDRLRWFCSAGAGQCGFANTGQAFANRMIFYSFDDNAPLVPLILSALNTTENADGSFQWVVPPPGVNVYNGLSDAQTPLPAALPLFVGGLALIVLFARRRQYTMPAGSDMTRFAVATLLAVVVASPAFAANEKPKAKADLATCRKLAHDKYFVQNGRALNKAVGQAVKRCMEQGPSAI